MADLLIHVSDVCIMLQLHGLFSTMLLLIASIQSLWVRVWTHILAPRTSYHFVGPLNFLDEL